MPKIINTNLIPYLYRKSIKVYDTYKFSIYAADDYKYIVNNEDRFTYTALGIKRSSIKSEEGTVLNELEISLDNADLSFREMIMGGAFDNKKCIIQKLFESSTGFNVGTFDLFIGYVDAPKGDDHWVTFTIRPYPILEREFPKRIYQIGCNWSFCDSYCGLDLSTYQVNNTLSVDSNGSVLTCAHGQAIDYFVPGYAQIMSGTYSGQYRPVLSNNTTTVTLRIPFENTIPAGTSIRLQKLCAKNPIACDDIFANYLQYGGYPFVPKKPIL